MDYLTATRNGVYCDGKPYLLRGMGLGNWLLTEGYMWKFYTKCDRPRRIEKLVEELCGEEYAKEFWKEFYERYITKEDIRWIKEQGLNSVRLPINARHLFYMDTSMDVFFNKPILTKLDQCISWCKEYGIYLFIDMHAAPGGQTGTNIDDSKNDSPDLFVDPIYEEILIKCWNLLALRYKDNPAVGGYDLINEPLPDRNKQYNKKVVPIYRKLIQTVRAVDKKHMIILEGVHWASDFSIFSKMRKEELADNIMLEFHKYWNNPDVESIENFMSIASSKGVPLWMGEGGENNSDWYTTAFPMYERNNIGWCFWSYKKMDTSNSPVSYDEPADWKKILDYLDDKGSLDKKSACEIFDAYLSSIAKPHYKEEIIRALLRKAPLVVPATAYDACDIKSERTEGATFRISDPVTICFVDGHKGVPDWKRYGGEEQPIKESLEITLKMGDSLGYRMEGRDAVAEYTGDGKLTIEKREDGLTWVTCVGQEIRLKRMKFQ